MPGKLSFQTSPRSQKVLLPSECQFIQCSDKVPEQMGNFQCTFNLPTQLVCFFVSFGKKQFPKRTWPTDRQRPTNCLATTPLRYDSHKNSCRPPPPCKTGCSPNCQVLIRQKLGSPTAVSLPLGDRNSSHLYIRWKFSAQELRISEPAF